MLILNAGDVRRALPMRDAVEAARQAFAALSGGRAEVPLRAHIPVRPHDGVTLVMPAFVDADSWQALSVKVVSVFGRNRERGLPAIQAAVVVLEPDTGRPLALLDGAALTAIRTAAASAAATDLLARPDSRTLAVFGAGVQARSHLEAMCCVRTIETVWVFAPTTHKVDALIAELAGRGAIPQDVRRAASPAEAVRRADIVCAATNAREPVFDDADLPSGIHINAVGAYTPDRREVPGQTVARALVVVDSRAAAWAEAGDLIQALSAGLIDREHIYAELGELVLGTAPGRADASQITLFKSVGVAVQDAVAAHWACRRATELGIGQIVAWDGLRDTPAGVMTRCPSRRAGDSGPSAGAANARSA